MSLPERRDDPDDGPAPSIAWRDDEQFARMTLRVARDRRLSHLGFRLLALMRGYGWRTGEVSVSQERLADDLGCTARRVRTVLDELEGAGYVEAAGRVPLAGVPGPGLQVHRLIDPPADEADYRKPASANSGDYRKPASGKDADYRKPASANRADYRKPASDMVENVVVEETGERKRRHAGATAGASSSEPGLVVQEGLAGQPTELRPTARSAGLPPGIATALDEILAGFGPVEAPDQIRAEVALLWSSRAAGVEATLFRDRLRFAAERAVGKANPPGYFRGDLDRVLSGRVARRAPFRDDASPADRAARPDGRTWKTTWTPPEEREPDEALLPPAQPGAPWYDRYRQPAGRSS